MTLLAGAQMVTTPIALVAFALAVGFYAYKAWLAQRRRLIQSVPQADRAEVVAKTLRLFHVDTGGLSRPQQYTLALEQIRAREDRFRLVAMLLAFLGVLLAGVTVFYMARPTAAPAQPTQALSTPSLNRTGAGAFHQALLRQSPLELHGLQVRMEKIGTPEGQLFMDIGEVIPNCTPEGANGHVRARTLCRNRL